MTRDNDNAITLFYWPTANGWKISILLEEIGEKYNVNFVNIGRGDQYAPDFLEISPNNKIPAITDENGPGGEPVSLFESGAILWYLARKFGQFAPFHDERGLLETEQWIYWQVGGFGPMLGQNHHFVQYAPERIPYAMERYVKETKRLYGVLNTRLSDREYVVGDSYSIADIAIFPWSRSHTKQQIDIEDYPNVGRWFDTISQRPAVQRGLALGEDRRFDFASDAASQIHLFKNRDSR